ncbi:ATP-binding cassette domain-containing protein [Vibrio sp. SCSIO 43136]|uniref:iron ABC transporter ATP-binding protein n=1 Tax=Vibrio sp. SCSIO 43136 TaxID=2819101 RepID=UPI0020757806|nr:ATP-binding cassette domain-containing protein [Vibrio sp. SCSIO 43136]USD63997.1 ATP-binding cassette domain-containing protein [Vibrio sp. SCSIO 43136]
MVTLNNLHKQYDNQIVIDDASASFNKGEITSIIGPNGAGKSTLLSMASRLLMPDAGDVIIDGKAIQDWDTSKLATRLSVLRQTNNLNMRFTVRELVAFGRFPYSKGKLTDRDQQVIDEAIEFLDLVEIKNRYTDQLSGGQRQLAFIAMILAQDTDYILLDEPLNNLDIRHSLQIMNTVRRLAEEKQKSVVVVIHDINFAAYYSDTIIALKQGRVVAQGGIEKIIEPKMLESIYDTPFTVEVNQGKRSCQFLMP